MEIVSFIGKSTVHKVYFLLYLSKLLSSKKVILLSSFEEFNNKETPLYEYHGFDIMYCKSFNEFSNVEIHEEYDIAILDFFDKDIL